MVLHNGKTFRRKQQVEETDGVKQNGLGRAGVQLEQFVMMTTFSMSCVAYQKQC